MSERLERLVQLFDREGDDAGTIRKKNPKLNQRFKEGGRRYIITKVTSEDVYARQLKK